MYNSQTPPLHKRIYLSTDEGMINAPNQQFVDFIKTALTYYHAEVSHDIADIAMQAAIVYQQYQAIQPMVAEIPACPHIYRTNKRRYAISQIDLCHATWVHNPNTLIEEALSENELAATCFFCNFELATFISKATCGTLAEAVILQPDTGICLVRDDDGFIPLQQLLSNASRLALQIYRNTFQMQWSICSLHLSMAQPVAG